MSDTESDATSSSSGSGTCDEWRTYIPVDGLRFLGISNFEALTSAPQPENDEINNNDIEMVNAEREHLQHSEVEEEEEEEEEDEDNAVEEQLLSDEEGQLLSEEEEQLLSDEEEQLLSEEEEHLLSDEDEQLLSEEGEQLLSEEEEQLLSEEEEQNFENKSPWRCFITKEGMRFLGLSTLVKEESPLVPDKLKLQEVEGEEDENALTFKDLSLEPQPSHIYLTIDDEDTKEEFLLYYEVNDKGENDKRIIFCDTAERAEVLSTKLRQRSLLPQVIHHKVPQKEQKIILKSFARGVVCRILICTDILLENSLEESELANIVINFNLPHSFSSYLQRCAFAQRFSKDPTTKECQSVIINYISSDEDMKILKNIEKQLGVPITPI